MMMVMMRSRSVIITIHFICFYVIFGIAIWILRSQFKTSFFKWIATISANDQGMLVELSPFGFHDISIVSAEIDCLVFHKTDIEKWFPKNIPNHKRKKQQNTCYASLKPIGFYKESS